MFRSTLRLTAAPAIAAFVALGTLRRVGAGFPQRSLRQQRPLLAAVRTAQERPQRQPGKRGAAAAAAGAARHASRRDPATRLTQRIVRLEAQIRAAHRRDRAVAVPQPAARSAVAAHAGRDGAARVPRAQRRAQPQPQSAATSAASRRRRRRPHGPARRACSIPRSIRMRPARRACSAQFRRDSPRPGSVAQVAIRTSTTSESRRPRRTRGRCAARSLDLGGRGGRTIAPRRSRAWSQRAGAPSPAPHAARRRLAAHRSRRCRRPTARATITTSPTAT